jgi:hypothetical protein
MRLQVYRPAEPADSDSSWVSRVHVKARISGNTALIGSSKISANSHH